MCWNKRLHNSLPVQQHFPYSSTLSQLEISKDQQQDQHYHSPSNAALAVLTGFPLSLLLIMASCQCCGCSAMSGKYQSINSPDPVIPTHFVYWNLTSKIFKQQDPKLSVQLDDEIVFVCPLDLQNNFEVRYTYDYSAYKTCDYWSAKHLVVCENLRKSTTPNRLWYRFSVTDFQFVPGNPEFKTNKPVYFMARQFYCYQNMKVEIVMEKQSFATENHSSVSKDDPDPHQNDMNLPKSPENASEKSVRNSSPLSYKSASSSAICHRLTLQQTSHFLALLSYLFSSLVLCVYHSFITTSRMIL